MDNNQNNFNQNYGQTNYNDYNEQNYNQAYNSQPYPNQMYAGAQNTFNANNIPDEYRPISMWGYFGYQLLFAIPCVGFILLLVFSFGGTKNINLRNYARSFFCMLIVVIILMVLLILFAGGLTGLAALSF